jgi:hypothetical protein
MTHTREQQLIDIMMQVAFACAEHHNGKSNEEIATWVADQLRKCGFDTQPMGASWAVLKNKQGLV